MYSGAYVDDTEQPYRNQPLRSNAARSVYSQAERAPRAPRLSPAQLRAEGRTRKAVVHGNVVQFMRLSPTCKVTAIWETFWHEEYESVAEAENAASVWEQRVKILPSGFSGGQL